MKKLTFFLSFLLLAVTSFAQTQASDKEYRRHPLWITMMDEPNANFFEVEKAYALYWSNHEKPEGENEEIGEHAAREKVPSKRKQRKISAENDLRFAVKKYEMWHEETIPYVQTDGRILSTEERLEIWKSQKTNH